LSSIKNKAVVFGKLIAFLLILFWHWERKGYYGQANSNN